MAGPNPADLEAATIFAEDCVLQGMLLRPDGRVSDTITSHGSLAVHEAEVVALDDGHDVPIGSLDIAPDEYIAIATAAGKGDGTRRRRTVTYAIALSAGPYRIRGHLHAPPSTDPMPYIWRRSSAVPLTNANVRYLVAGTLVTRDLPVVIVRMTTVDAIVDADARPWDAALLMGMRE